MATFSERLAYVLTFDTTSGVKSLQKFGATADKELSKADKKSQKFWATTEKASAGMVAMAGVAGVGLAKMAMGALDTQQNVEALRQVVGDVITEDMEGWAEGAANAIGMSKAAAVDSATAFAQLGKMAGFSGEGLSTMATNLVELGADFAAFKNVSPEKAVQDIRSAFSGSVEVMRKYGIFLDDLTLKAAYFRETGHEVTGTMTGQQKVIAVNAELYRQGADMIGQFGRESATLAGQLPILKANLRNISDAVGAGVLPAPVVRWWRSAQRLSVCELWRCLPVRSVRRSLSPGAFIVRMRPRRLRLRSGLGSLRRRWRQRQRGKKVR
jgi:hypothetical protein